MGKATHQEGYTFKGRALKRGELVTTYDKIAEALSFTVNRRIIKPTLKEIRVMLCWLQSEGMIFMKPLIDGTLPNKGRPIDRTRAYVGLLISIINYDTYQDSESYKGSNKGRPIDEQGQLDTQEGLQEGLQEGNKTPCDFSSKISELEKRYSDQGTINQAFQAISSTRKSKRIAGSVRLSILKSWERYPVESVMAGIKTFLEKGYADQGKKEAYLLGIIRNNGDNGKLEDSAVRGQSMKSTGSPLLDSHYKSQGITII